MKNERKQGKKLRKIVLGRAPTLATIAGIPEDFAITVWAESREHIPQRVCITYGLGAPRVSNRDGICGGFYSERKLSAGALEFYGAGIYHVKFCWDGQEERASFDFERRAEMGTLRESFPDIPGMNQRQVLAELILHCLAKSRGTYDSAFEAGLKQRGLRR